MVVVVKFDTLKPWLIQSHSRNEDKRKSWHKARISECHEWFANKRTLKYIILLGTT